LQNADGSFEVEERSMKQRGRCGLVGVALIAASCSGADINSAGGPTIPSRVDLPTQGNVRIARVRAFIKDGGPQLFIEGELGDGCTSLESVSQRRTGNRFDITLESRRHGDVCTMILQFLNEWVPLDGSLTAGEYIVQVNSYRVSFRLFGGSTGWHIDPDPGPVPQPPYVPPSGAATLGARRSTDGAGPRIEDRHYETN
jgi:hypothetical protein